MNDDELRQVKHAAELHGVPVRQMVEVLLDDDVGDAEAVLTEEAGPEAGAPKPKSRKLHWTAWTASMVAMGAVVGLVIVGLLKFVNDPVEAGAKSLQKAQASVAPSVAPDTSQLSGLYVTLTYPGEFDQVQQVKSNARALEQYRLGSKTNHRRSITVSVWPLPPGGMQDEGSYRVRQLDLAGSYDESREKIAGEDITLMTKADKSEQTLFTTYKDKLLVVAVTSSDSRDDVPKLMNVIKQSVRWVK